MMAQAGASEANTTLLAAAVVVGVVGLLAIGLLFLVTRPRRPTAAPATVDLGPERPGVVDLLTDDFQVTTEAAPATLIDLAARRWLEIEQMPDGTVMCRFRPEGGRGELTAYEEQVLALVRERTVDDCVPLPALTTGTGRRLTSWQKSFRNAVIDDGQRLGLCRDRFHHGHAGLALAAAAATFGLVWLAGGLEEDVSAPVTREVAVGEAMALGAAFGGLEGSRRQRETQAGFEAAGRWLGVRTYLRDHGAFADQPAAAVMLWDRYLAYAAALGLAGRVVEEVPLGAEDDHHAWSVASGRWRPVSVSYPRLRPGWGRHPVFALVTGVPAAFVLWRIAFAVWGWGDDLAPPGPTVTGVIAALFGWAGLWWALQVAGGLGDLTSSRQIEGVVVRRREKRRFVVGPRDALASLQGRREKEPWYFLALDDGSREVVAAWSVRHETYAATSQQARVRAAVTPLLRHVRSIEVLGPVADAAQPGRGDDQELRRRAGELAGLDG